MTENKDNLNAVGAALAAYREAEMENAARLKEADTARLVQASKRFEDFFGCAPDDGGISEDHRQAWFISGTYKIFYNFQDRYWSIAGSCPICGMETQSPRTGNLATLGKYMQHFEPEYEHKDICRAPELAEPEVPVVQTAEQVLLQALRDVIHNAIQDALSQ